MTRAGVFLIAVLFAGFFAASAAAAAPQSPEHGPSVAVTVTKLQKGSLARRVTAYGMVGTGPAARQTIQAPISLVVDTIDVKPGEEVAAQAPLLRVGPSPATAAAYSQATAALRAANADVARTRSLLAQHLATRQQLVAADKAVADARAALAALTAEGADRPRVLRAPFAAIVTMVAASPGAIVAQGAPLIDLARPTQLVLHAGVIPSKAVVIHPGDKAEIVPLGDQREAAGQVLLRGSVVDAKTGLVAVDVSLPAGRFFAGEMAEAKITIGKAEGYVVPHAAVLVDDRGAPYVVQAVDGRARRVPVHVVLSDGAKDVIAGPLDAAAPLVLTGNYQLTDGMKIRAAPRGPGK